MKQNTFTKLLAAGAACAFALGTAGRTGIHHDHNHGGGIDYGEHERDGRHRHHHHFLA